MNDLAENLLHKIQPIVETFASSLRRSNPALICDFGGTSNDAFLLRVYLSLRANDDGEEIAITVDVRADDRMLTVVSDICGGDGQIIRVGPEARAAWVDGQPVPDDVLRTWLSEFDQFLGNAGGAVAHAVSGLS